MVPLALTASTAGYRVTAGGNCPTETMNSPRTGPLLAEVAAALVGHGIRPADLRVD